MAELKDIWRPSAEDVLQDAPDIIAALRAELREVAKERDILKSRPGEMTGLEVLKVAAANQLRALFNELFENVRSGRQDGITKFENGVLSLNSAFAVAKQILERPDQFT